MKKSARLILPVALACALALLACRAASAPGVR